MQSTAQNKKRKRSNKIWVQRVLRSFFISPNVKKKNKWKNESANKYHLKRISAEKKVTRIFQYKQKVSKIPTRNSAKHLKWDQK